MVKGARRFQIQGLKPDILTPHPILLIIIHHIPCKALKINIATLWHSKGEMWQEKILFI